MREKINLENNDRPLSLAEKTGEEILAMAPEELRNYFRQLYKNGNLEDFLQQAVEDDSLVAQFSYWEKWFTESQRKLVDSIIEKKREIYDGETKANDHEALPLHLEKKFTPEELKLICQNLCAIQLTFGCSKGCPFCGLDAVKGVREHIKYSDLENLFKIYGDNIAEQRPIFYYASETSDYHDQVGLEDKTYQDVHELASKYLHYSPHITSKENSLPWMEFLKQESKQHRMSLYGLSEEEINTIKTIAEDKVEFVGEKSTKHIKGIGVSILSSEDMIGGGGIGCFDGITLTPRGLYNILMMPISKKFPQGQMIVPIKEISKDSLNVNVGDNLADVLNKTVIVGYWTTREGYDNEDKPFLFKMQEAKVKIRKCVVKTVNEEYNLWFDCQGVIKSIEKFDEIYDKKVKNLRDSKMPFKEFVEQLSLREKMSHILKNFIDQGKIAFWYSHVGWFSPDDVEKSKIEDILIERISSGSEQLKFELDDSSSNFNILNFNIISEDKNFNQINISDDIVLSIEAKIEYDLDSQNGYIHIEIEKMRKNIKGEERK